MGQDIRGERREGPAPLVHFYFFLCFECGHGGLRRVRDLPLGLEPRHQGRGVWRLARRATTGGTPGRRRRRGGGRGGHEKRQVGVRIQKEAEHRRMSSFHLHASQDTEGHVDMPLGFGVKGDSSGRGGGNRGKKHTGTPGWRYPR